MLGKDREYKVDFFPIKSSFWHRLRKQTKLHSVQRYNIAASRSSGPCTEILWAHRAPAQLQYFCVGGQASAGLKSIPVVLGISYKMCFCIEITVLICLFYFSAVVCSRCHSEMVHALKLEWLENKTPQLKKKNHTNSLLQFLNAILFFYGKGFFAYLHGRPLRQKICLFCACWLWSILFYCKIFYVVRH